jgi:hypothetical protein
MMVGSFQMIFLTIWIVFFMLKHPLSLSLCPSLSLIW